VSRRYKTIAPRICRRRLLTLCLRPGPQHWTRLRKFYEACEKSTDNNILWSSCVIISCRDSSNADWIPFNPRAAFFSPGKSQEFIRKCGSHLRKLTLGSDNLGLVVLLLRETPHLEHLVLCVTLDEASARKKKKGEPTELDWDGIGSPGTGPPDFLRMLKRMDVVADYTGQFPMKFIKFLLNNTSTARLNYISLPPITLDQFDDNSEVEALRSLAEALVNIPFISLTIGSDYSPLGSCEFLKTLTGNQLHVRQLHLVISDPNPTDCIQVQLFLEDIAEFVEELRITDFSEDESRTRLSSKIQVPRLPILKGLQIYGHLEAPSCRFVVPFISDQFPTCKKVEIYNSTLVDRNVVFASAQFPSVEELVLTHSCGYYTPGSVKSKWNNTFPNLRKLKARVNKTGLRHILSKMTLLESLDLIVDNVGGLGPFYDINSILSGASNRSLVTSKRSRKKPPPSLLSMTCK